MIRLQAFEKNAFTAGIEVEAQMVESNTGYVLSFQISGSNASQIIYPQKSLKPQRKDELWKETCVECFFGVKGASQYFEFNGSPSGDWAMYSFEAYRTGMKDVEFKTAVPILTASASRIEWHIPRFTHEALADLSFTAVIKTAKETTHWALAHSGQTPDFHLRESFKLGI